MTMVTHTCFCIFDILTTVLSHIYSFSAFASSLFVVSHLWCCKYKPGARNENEAKWDHKQKRKRRWCVLVFCPSLASVFKIRWDSDRQDCLSGRRPSLSLRLLKRGCRSHDRMFHRGVTGCQSGSWMMEGWWRWRGCRRRPSLRHSPPQSSSLSPPPSHSFLKSFSSAAPH